MNRALSSRHEVSESPDSVRLVVAVSPWWSVGGLYFIPYMTHKAGRVVKTNYLSGFEFNVALRPQRP